MISDSDIITLCASNPEAIVAWIRSLEAHVLQLEAQVQELKDEVQELKNRLSKDSHNSSKPPSSDGLSRRPPKPKSLRPRTDRSPGAQWGHSGHSLEPVEAPDHTKLHPLDTCKTCGGALGEPIGAERRQVFDLPPLRLQVTEHQALNYVCPHCQAVNQAEFPAHVAQPVQYGPGVLGLCVYLTHYQLLPFARTKQLLTDLLGKSPCEGTLALAHARCYDALASVEAAIKEAITAAQVAHFDETGMRVEGLLQWLHVACTRHLTYYARHQKRGRAALAELDILSHFTGVSVHDYLASYRGAEYPCSHALCNAHLLRELTALWETTRQTWTQRMSALLLCLKRAKEQAHAAGQTQLHPQMLARCCGIYRRILHRALKKNPLPQPTGKRGRPAKGPLRCLLERLDIHQPEVLRFATNFAVPFDNNQAERDLRMVKVREKVSGCFRSATGANHFCRIRGYICTLRKQGIDIIEALRSVFAGNPICPSLGTT
jgi:transposase